jgi:hypothetical protein
MKKITLFLFTLHGLCCASSVDTVPTLDTTTDSATADQSTADSQDLPTLDANTQQPDDTSDNTSDDTSSDSGLSAGAIAGIVAGGAAAVAGLATAGAIAKSRWPSKSTAPAANFEISTPATGLMGHQDTTADIINQAKTPEELRQIQARLQDSMSTMDTDLQKARDAVLAERDAQGDSPDIQRRLANLDQAEQDNEVKKATIQNDIDRIQPMIAEREAAGGSVPAAGGTKPAQTSATPSPAKPSMYQRLTGQAAAAKAVAPGGSVAVVKQQWLAQQDAQKRLIAEQAQDQRNVGSLAQSLQAQQQKIAQIQNQRQLTSDATQQALLDEQRQAALAERDTLQDQHTVAKQAYIQKWTAPQPQPRTPEAAPSLPRPGMAPSLPIPETAPPLPRRR